MSAKEILTKICEFSEQNGSSKLEYVLQQAFNEYDGISLLKKRALLCEHCEYVLRDISYDKDTLKDILSIVAYKDLSCEISYFRDTLNTTQKHLINSVFSHYEMKNRYEDEMELKDIIDISATFEEEIKTASDISDEQKELLLGFCELVNEAKEQSKITGAREIVRLHIIFIGRLVIYQDKLKTLKDHKLFEKLKWLYAKIEGANKVYKILKEFGVNFILPFIG
ncbi:hypothetical protein [Campylobacter fetus]|uniref:hypothetical protein n=1 Tax=Campylobacter fetus TaxID=196 RepID=UPI00138E268D|nr:hypothetical protein [Campylobacter fetus]